MKKKVKNEIFFAVTFLLNNLDIIQEHTGGCNIQTNAFFRSNDSL